MPKRPTELFAFLEILGIAVSTVSHPPLFTVADSQALRGEIPGGHTKNLFLKDKKDNIFLVTVDEEARWTSSRSTTSSAPRAGFPSASRKR